MKHISLKDLFQGFISTDELPELSIAGISSDSRQIKKGEIFFAYPGLKVDGRKFLAAAHAQGAAVIVCEKHGIENYREILQQLRTQLVVIELSEVQTQLSAIAARFYNYPSRAMTVIGVTGTNGKTSCTHFIAQILNKLGMPCAVMGTLGNGIPPNLAESEFTTQDAIAVQKTLSELRDQGVSVVAMEVSSHGLAQHRVDAVEFSMAVLTQLSRDHLDYHGNLEEYAAAKECLFHFASLKQAVLNLDDELGCRLMQSCAPSVKCLGYTQGAKNTQGIQCVVADKIKLKAQGFDIHVQTPWGEGSFSTSLLGRFNISNLLAVLGVLGLLQQTLTQVLSLMPQLQQVKGRLQSFGGGAHPQVIVDYAHTPDALEKVLGTLREHCRGKLWCVFGCGGDRDRGKRPLMAAVAERFSDHIILTDDNPRSEPSEQIAREIQQGFSAKAPVELILDRASAIKFAIQKAAPNDMILVAGKGHEEYQLVASKRLAFSDQEQVQKELKAL